MDDNVFKFLINTHNIINHYVMKRIHKFSKQIGFSIIGLDNANLLVDTRMSYNEGSIIKFKLKDDLLFNIRESFRFPIEESKAGNLIEGNIIYSNDTDDILDYIEMIFWPFILKHLKYFFEKWVSLIEKPEYFGVVFPPLCDQPPFMTSIITHEEISTRFTLCSLFSENKHGILFDFLMFYFDIREMHKFESENLIKHKGERYA